MKVTKSEIHTRAHSIPELRFEDQQLSSYAGVIIFQKFFQKINLRKRIAKCFRHRKGCYGLQTIVMSLVLHFILGSRRIRDLDYYKNDPLIKRFLGLKKLPDVSTISRSLKDTDLESYTKFKAMGSELVLERIKKEKLARATFDFDGSGQSTQGHAEGTAVGFNKKKKGARSLYNLYCTVAQTGQVLDWLDRSGNVHDSNGAAAFMEDCFEQVRETKKDIVLESRMDSAFFSDEIIENLNNAGVEFTASVPFERFVELKGKIESRQRWRRLDDTWSYFEEEWKPDCWSQTYRFIFVRQKQKKQTKGPLQLDLFVPVSHEYTYKVIVTNKTCGVKTILPFHNGRGSQEGIFAECKQHTGMGYIPFRREISNRIYHAASIMAHNLGREIQMDSQPRVRTTTPKRPALWVFDSLGSLCRRIVQRAGRLTNRSGKWTLTMNADESARHEINECLNKLAS